MKAATGRRRQNHGFTLIELLIGGVLSVIALGSVAILGVHQIRIADRVYALTTINRNFRRISDLLKTEAGEACLLRRGVDPGTSRTITLPDTRCKPAPASAPPPAAPNNAECATPSATADLRLLVPIQGANNTISYDVIRYELVGTELRRIGPQVDTNGLLTTTPSTSVGSQRVLTNVSTFVPTVSADCTWVRLDLGLSVPGSADVETRTLTLYSGASESIN
ncbi:prepilin-type N-terminal cleavage/methylation domain-containing protein [Cyanobium sp. Cruz-8D1]|nr:prepilin-type N-terminal cleavage/methylation domain-containing protein [Cyanobium sp. Cruz-8D1]